MKTSNGARKRYIALLAAVFVPALCLGASLVNINTADETALETLPGIGPSKAAAIIEYRTGHGSFASVADIQNVSGIGPSTYANLEAFITVGEEGDRAEAETDAPSSSSSTPSAGGATTYQPPPSALVVSVPESAVAYLHVPLSLSASVTTGSGARDPNVSLAWNFGDGSTNTGNPVQKIYRYPGTYAVSVTAEDGNTIGHAELSVTVMNTDVHVSAVSGAGVTLENAASDELDLSGWSLMAEGSVFRFPNDTHLLPGASVLFPQSVTNLPVDFSTRLLYPDGMVASVFAVPPASEVKLDELPERSNSVKGVDSVVSVSLPAHEQPVVAPAFAPSTSTEAGAPFSAAATDVASAPGASGLLRSPWTYGFLGVLTVAGGAFLIL